MPKFNTVIPLLHRKCKLFQNVPLLLDDNIAVRSLKTEHIGAIISKRRSLSEHLNSKTKCILVQGGDSKTPRNVIENIALLGPFVLNVFAKSGASVCEQAFTVKHVRSHSVIEVTELTSLSAATYANYEIDTSTKPSAIKTLYSSAALALTKILDFQ